MNRLILLLAASLLDGCVSIGGSDDAPTSRFMLQGAEKSCQPGDRALVLSINKVGSGLNNDRVARLETASGEMTYLKGVRWIDNVGQMVEQRLATDLECAGYTVQTGHRSRAGHDHLACEVRALNLLHGGGTDQAAAGLSCLYFNSASATETALTSSSRVTISRWNSAQAMAALSSAYDKVFHELISDLNNAD